MIRGDRLGPVVGKQNEVVRHMRTLPHRDVAAALATVRASNAVEVVKLAFEFLVLAVARWDETRGTQWNEMDTSAYVWTIRRRGMKANREHRVPLPACSGHPGRGSDARRWGQSARVHARQWGVVLQRKESRARGVVVHRPSRADSGPAAVSVLGSRLISAFSSLPGVK